jgi:hypothetical protein
MMLKGPSLMTQPLQPIDYRTTGVPLPFNNQKPALMAIGIILIIVGAFFGCVSLSLPTTLLLQSAGNTVGANFRSVSAVIGMTILYIGLAAGTIGCGIGTLLARRWIPPILTILCTVAVVVGISAFIFMLVSAATADFSAINYSATVATTGPATTPAMTVPMNRSIGMVAVVGGAVVILLFMVAAPAALLWFIRRPSVQQTVEYFDPQMRWTDLRPFPVLAVSLVSWLWAPFILSQAPTELNNFFGIILAGAASVVVTITQASLLLAGGWLVWKQRPAGWWILVLLGSEMILSAAVSGMLLSNDQIIRAMELDPQAEAQMRQMPATQSTALLSSILTIGAAMFYLFRHRQLLLHRETESTSGLTPSV